MGLAASQGRYLCLTARMSDLIYEGQQLSQQRLNLAEETQAAAEKYNKAMNNMVMQALVIDKSTGEQVKAPLTYELLTDPDPFSGLNMRIVDVNGNVVIPSLNEKIEASTTQADGTTSSEKIATVSDFINKFMPDLGIEDADMASKMSLKEIQTYYSENYPKKATNVSFTMTNEVPSYLKSSEERYCIDENATDSAYLQDMLESGQWLLQQRPEPESTEWENFVWQGSNKILEVYDTSDDAAAESEYEATMKALERKDKLLDLRLEQVQTEEDAVETEIDSIKQVIGKNVEDSFGTFA